MGRPRRNLAKKHYELLEKWWEEGKAPGTMAKQLDMAESTLYAILKRDPRAKRHWEWGKAKRESLLWAALHSERIKNKTPIIFELKSRFGYFDKPAYKPEVEESRVKVEVRIPAPLDEKHYKELAAKWAEEKEIVDVTPRQIEGEVVRND